MAPGETSLADEPSPASRFVVQHVTIRTLIRWMAVVLICLIAEQGIASLAGRSTFVFVDATLKLFADLKFTLAVTWAIGATGWAFIERWFRRKKVEAMQGRIRKLESLHDPNSSTSGLMPNGATNPNDRV